MKLIESSVEYLPQEEDMQGIYKQIEVAGRTAYHSQDKITENSAKDFVDRMIKSNHYATLEHGTIYLKLPYDPIYMENPYSKTLYDGYDNDMFVTTNYRVLQENGLLDDLKYLCEPTDQHEKRYIIRFICSRAIANELVRHRKFSFAQESQRYCNYSKDKYGNEITFIKPFWLKEISFDIEEKYLESLSQAEDNYLWFLHWLQPQQARDVLPNATKTELIMTGFASDWRYLLDLRLFEKTGKVHPDMLDLMQKLQKTMQKADIWEDIMRYPSKF